MGYRRRQFNPVLQTALNKRKLGMARSLVGRQVVINGVMRTVTGVSELTGEVEIQVGIRTQVYDPMTLTVVEKG